MSALRDMTMVQSEASESEVLRLVGDRLRAEILRLLAQEQLCTCHLVELTGATQTNISNHLRLLREAGVVRSEPCGRFTYYRLDADTMARVADHFTALATAARASQHRRRPC